MKKGERGLTCDTLLWWYMAFPILLFAAGWFVPVVGGPLVLGVAWTMSVLPQVKPAQNIPRQCLALTLAFAVAITWLTIANRFPDWEKHRALFLDLFRCAWPVYYDKDNAKQLLAFYLPYYLPPTLASGFSDSTYSLGVAVGLWTLLGYAIVFCAYFRRAMNAREWLGLCVLLLLFGVWQFIDPIGDWRDQTPEAFFLSRYIVQASAGLIAFLWVPQHTLAAWLCGLLLVSMHDWQKLRYGGLLAAFAAYWSPLVALGLAPFLAFDYASALRRGKWRLIIHRHNLIALALVVPYELYLTRDPYMVPHGWNWDHMADFWLSYAWFFFRATLAMSALTLVLNPAQLRQPYFYIAVAIMLLAPLYRLGLWHDSTMRLPMVSYFYLLWAAGEGLLRDLRRVDPAPREKRARMARLAVAALLLVPRVNVVRTDLESGFHDALRRSPFERYVRGLQVDMFRYPLIISQYVVPMDMGKEVVMRPAGICPAQEGVLRPKAVAPGMQPVSADTPEP
jgi:hypothetical protein